MAPKFWGVRRTAKCDHCKNETQIPAESTQAGWPVRCLACGGTCSLESKPTPGDRVEITPLASPPERLSVVAIETDAHASNQPQTLLKRVWGLPGEQIAIGGGELWIDGQMLQKTLSQLRTVAVPLAAEWEKTSRSDSKPTEQFLWRCRYPAPVHPTETSVSKWMGEGPISDAAPITPPAGLAPLANGDVYLKIHLQSAASDLVIEYFYLGRPYRVEINSSATQTAKESGPIAKTLSARRTIEVAFCDDRLLLAGDEHLLAPTPLNENSGMAFPSNSRASITITSPAGQIRSVSLSRDIILRSTERNPGQRQDFPRLGSAKYFALGDNQPYSDDSRTALGNIPVSQIIGTVREQKN